MHNQIQLRRACVANSSCCGSSCILHYSCSIGFHCNNLIACFWIQQLREILSYTSTTGQPEVQKHIKAETAKVEKLGMRHTHTLIHTKAHRVYQFPLKTPLDHLLFYSVGCSTMGSAPKVTVCACVWVDNDPAG